MIFIIISKSLHFDLTEKALFQVILGLLLVCADWEKGGVCLRVCMCVCFMTENCWDMFFVVRSNDSFNFALGWIKYIVIVVIVTFPNRSVEPDVPETESQKEWCRLFSLKKKAEIEVPEGEGHDGCQRLMCQRRMVQTCVPETDGVDLCHWDERPGRAAEDVPVTEIFGTEDQGGHAWVWKPIWMAQTDAHLV